MFNYSEKTIVNKQFKMNELFKLIKADKTMKTSTENIASVCLTHVLSPTTTNLEPSKNVKEIYVINIDIKTKEMPDKFIEALNKQILFQTLFKVCYNSDVKYICSLKVFDENYNMKVLKTYSTDWQKQLHKDLPITTKLEEVYKTIIANIVGYGFRIDETFNDYMERTSNIKRQKIEIERLIKLMNAEKQPNIKMNINDRIKQMEKDLQRMEE
jgi:preprotein translocase subunit SecB